MRILWAEEVRVIRVMSYGIYIVMVIDIRMYSMLCGGIILRVVRVVRDIWTYGS